MKQRHLQHGIVDFIQNVGLTKSIFHAFPKKGLRRNLVDYENDRVAMFKIMDTIPNFAHLGLLYMTPNFIGELNIKNI
jgi:hypothetical protein